MRKRPYPSKVCPNCENSFTPKYPNAQCCSIKCRGEYFSKTRNTKIKTQCGYCGKETEKSPCYFKENKNNYCNQQCYRMDRKRKDLEKSSFSSSRGYRRNHSTNQCLDCGYDKHPEILLVHHVDGDRNNNLLKNLIILCPNCHALRHTVIIGNRGLPKPYYKADPLSSPYINRSEGEATNEIWN